MDISAEEYARLLIDNVSAIVVGLDTDGKIRFFNRGAESITGFRSEEVIGHDWFSLLVPRDEFPDVWQSFQRATGPGPLREYDENPVRTADGSQRVILWRNTPLVLGETVVGTLSFGLDITERRQAESRAHASESKFRRFIEAAPIAIVVVRDGRLVYANPSMAGTLGYSGPDELIGGPIVDLVHPDDRTRHLERYRDLVPDDPGPVAATLRMRRRDGEVLTFEWSSILVDFDGAPAVLDIGRDVTDELRLHAQLVESERVAALGVLTAGIAHEINNPLTYLLLNLDVLERIAVCARRGQAPPDELDARLGEVREAAERVSDIVRDLRAFSRSGQDTPTRVDLGGVVRAGLKMVNNELRHRARLEVDIGRAPAVIADERRLIQVLLNLVTNALQALPETHTEHNWVRVRVAEEDRGAILTVSDSGPGLEPEVLRRIFDPFFTTKPVGEGIGLGLSIARGIVRSYGGTIRAERASGGGAAFRVWLPAAPSDAAAVAPATPDTEAAAAGPPLRILVVDDEPLIAAAVRDVLSPPHQVDVVTRPEDAVAMVTAGAHDLILCDLMMPGMSGIDIYESVAAHAPELADRFVFMTGGAFTRRASDFLARCDRPYIAKPFDHTDLDRLLRPPSGT